MNIHVWLSVPLLHKNLPKLSVWFDIIPHAAPAGLKIYILIIKWLFPTSAWLLTPSLPGTWTTAGKTMKPVPEVQ